MGLACGFSHGARRRGPLNSSVRPHVNPFRKQLKAHAKADVTVVEEILRRWDPIGVNPGPGEDNGPMDEYDSYAPAVLSLLMRGATGLEIEKHLVRIRVEQMSHKAYPPSDRPIAAELVSWWKLKVSHK